MPMKTNAAAGRGGKPRQGGTRSRARSAARTAGRNRPPQAANAGGEAHPHTEANLDHGLKETFPASDPVSISPGAD